jgi:DNA-binding response OmpR family regulator
MILLVDDEADIVYMMRVILRSAGYDVRSAAGVAEARSFLRTERPELIVLDVRLGDGEGWEVLDAMRADDRLRDVPVLVVSAHVSGAAEEVARERGANGYIAKPFSAGDFISAVREQAAS